MSTSLYAYAFFVKKLVLKCINVSHTYSVWRFVWKSEDMSSIWYVCICFFKYCLVSWSLIFQRGIAPFWYTISCIEHSSLNNETSIVEFHIEINHFCFGLNVKKRASVWRLTRFIRIFFVTQFYDRVLGFCLLFTYSCSSQSFNVKFSNEFAWMENCMFTNIINENLDIANTKCVIFVNFVPYFIK